MKLNTTFYLLKKGIKKSSALDLPNDVQSLSFTREQIEFDFFWKFNIARPRWIDLFSSIEGFPAESIQSRNIIGLLKFNVGKRTLCMTFGHGRHLVNQRAVERYFGLKVALCLADPTALRSLDKLQIGPQPFRYRGQSSKLTGIDEFEFTFESELLKTLTGVVNSSDIDDYELVTGSDSVSLYTEIELKKIHALGQRLIDAYSSQGYKKKFPWIDYIVPIKDQEHIGELEEQILKLIQEKKFDNVWIAPPDIISYENFSGFCYRKQKKGKSSQITTPELDLDACISAKKVALENITIKWLRSTEIKVLGADDIEIQRWPLFLCLNAEFDLKGERYLLSEGVWFQLDPGFVETVEGFFQTVPRADIPFPGYNGSHEAVYLEELADSEDFWLLDQKFVKPNSAQSKIEFCDLIYRKNDIVHVKKYSSSSVTSVRLIIE